MHMLYLKFLPPPVGPGAAPVSNHIICGINEDCELSYLTSVRFAVN